MDWCVAGFFFKQKVQLTNYLQIHFYMVLIITEVLFEACISEVPKLPNEP